ncbi:MAG: hypothetical protein EOO59_03080 [Hymenobacter sp.]|nr:MAG: hypothetical protein EOO59_03080 [Hymenobacter sp.]
MLCYPDEHDLATWPKGRPSLCGDLSPQYASKPAGLTFIGGAAGQPGGQTVAVAFICASQPRPLWPSKK